MLTWPNKATTSTDCMIKLELDEIEAFCNKTLVVCRVAKVTLRTTCCILDNWRSTFLLLGLSWFHISGLTFVALMSSQFSGRLYLSSRFFNFSEESFFPQRFVAVCQLLHDFVAGGVIILKTISNVLEDLSLQNGSFPRLAGGR